MSDRFRASLGTLVAQLFFIAAGVYLGNQADQWKEERDHQQAARAGLVAMRAELRANRSQLAERLPYHRAIADSFVVLARRPAPPRSYNEALRLLGWRGSRPIVYGRTAWTLAQTTQGAAYLPLDLTLRIARVYEQQENTRAFQERVWGPLFTPEALEPQRTRPWLEAFYSSIDDIRVIEAPLLEQYDRLLPGIDSALVRLPK